MEKNIESLKVQLKYYKKERFKEMLKDGDFLVVPLYPLGMSAIGVMPIVVANVDTKEVLPTVVCCATLGLATGIAHLSTKFKYALYTNKIKLIKKEIKEQKKLQKTLK